MDGQAESFPMMLYRRFRSGETVEQLAVAFDIPEERVEWRLRAAALYAERSGIRAGLLSLQSNVAQ